MEQVVVFGAGSGLGFEIAKYFSKQKFDVIAVGRKVSTNEELRQLCKQTIDCDATVQQSVENLVAKLPKNIKVISTMGSFGANIPVDYIGHRYLINALEKAEIKRLVLVTSLGCGDSWQYLSPQAKQGFGSAVREKSLAESWLKSSNLDYTIIRPGGLKNGEITETARLTTNQEVHGLISRSELARVIYQLIDANDTFYQTYECVDPTFSTK